jgi:hypothetical protein
MEKLAPPISFATASFVALISRRIERSRSVSASLFFFSSS